MSEANTPGSLSPGTATLAPSQPATGQDQPTGNQTPTETPTPAQQSAGQPQGDDFGGFKSKDELVKAYNELRSWNTRLSQEVKQIQTKLEPQPETQQVTPQDILNQFVQAPQAVLEGVRDQAVNEAMSRVSATLTVSRVIEEARAQNPEIVTPENEDFLASLARKAPVPDGTDSLTAAKIRMEYAIKGFRDFASKIKASGVKEGQNNAAMRAQAGFETGSVNVNSQPGLNKDAALKLLRDNPEEYKRLWKEKPNEMIAAFSS